MAIGAALAARLETAVLHRIVPCIAASCLIGVAAQAADPAAPPAAAAPVISPEALAHAAQIRAEVDARYPGLRVTEASSTAVIESLTFFEGADPRVVLANNGIYYAVCPNRARCPFPGRKARLVAALVPRRVALELAVRTFLETSANLVMVSLPTRRFIVLASSATRSTHMPLASLSPVTSYPTDPRSSSVSSIRRRSHTCTPPSRWPQRQPASTHCSPCHSALHRDDTGRRLTDRTIPGCPGWSS
jgi:hypothetical protein